MHDDLYAMPKAMTANDLAELLRVHGLVIAKFENNDRNIGRLPDLVFLQAMRQLADYETKRIPENPVMETYLVKAVGALKKRFGGFEHIREIVAPFRSEDGYGPIRQELRTEFLRYLEITYDIKVGDF